MPKDLYTINALIILVIYNAVLRASKAVINELKPGVSWIAMHKLANRITLEDLVKAGILKGDVDEMMKVCKQLYLQSCVLTSSKPENYNFL